MKRGIIGVLILLVSAMVYSQTIEKSQDHFRQGNEFYKAKDYTSASAAYQHIVDEGYLSAELYHNLANAYYEQGEIAKGILYYEKALQLKSDKNTVENLAIARSHIDDSIIEVPDFILVRMWRSISGVFSSTVWMVLQFIFGLMMVYGIYLWRLREESSQKVRGFGLSLLALVLLMFSYLAGSKAYSSETVQDSGIVMTPSQLIATPNEGAEEIENLSPGVKVRIMDTVDDWYQVLLINKEQGWLLKSGVELI